MGQYPPRLNRAHKNHGKILACFPQQSVCFFARLYGMYETAAQGHCTSVPDKNTGAGVLPGGRVYRTEKEKAA